MSMNEPRRFTEEEVCRMFDVDPAIIESMPESSYERSKRIEKQIIEMMLETVEIIIVKQMLKDWQLFGENYGKRY